MFLTEKQAHDLLQQGQSAERLSSDLSAEIEGALLAILANKLHARQSREFRRQKMETSLGALGGMLVMTRRNIANQQTRVIVGLFSVSTLLDCLCNLLLSTIAAMLVNPSVCVPASASTECGADSPAFVCCVCSTKCPNLS